jgi:hypothetical protein
MQLFIVVLGYYDQAGMLECNGNQLHHRSISPICLRILCLETKDATMEPRKKWTLPNTCWVKVDADDLWHEVPPSKGLADSLFNLRFLL